MGCSIYCEFEPSWNYKPESKWGRIKFLRKNYSLQNKYWQQCILPDKSVDLSVKSEKCLWLKSPGKAFLVLPRIGMATAPRIFIQARFYLMCDLGLSRVKGRGEGKWEVGQEG